MILDAQLQLSSSQALSSAGSTASTNSIDLEQDRNIGIGEPMSVVIFCKTALAGTSPTLQASIQTDDNSGFSSAATIITSQTLSAMAAGDKLVVPFPANASSERYVRVNYTLGGTTPSATVSAFLVPTSSIQNDAYYADAITIA